MLKALLFQLNFHKLVRTEENLLAHIIHFPREGFVIKYHPQIMSYYLYFGGMHDVSLEKKIAKRRYKERQEKSSYKEINFCMQRIGCPNNEVTMEFPAVILKA